MILFYGIAMDRSGQADSCPDPSTSIGVEL
jgi:hypothetical protein